MINCQIFVCLEKSMVGYGQVIVMEKKDKIILPLNIDQANFFYRSSDLQPFQDEVNSFLEDIHFMKTRDFAYKVMFSQEVKSNNNIEGYLDDINLVKSIIRHPSNVLNEEQKRRILNLYQGYQYIATHQEVNPETLKELYRILSFRLLNDYEQATMGDYYRQNPVYIYFSDRMDVEPDQGIDAADISEKMRQYFEFFHHSLSSYDQASIYIHSQILHFFFCAIHPYYDINGRTSRTMSMWYLLNYESYPFIIFNRAIQLDKSRYYKVIREGKKYHNITYFLKYMLQNGLVELEKEYAMQEIASSTPHHLSAADYQAMYYVLSMKGNWTLADFATFYNRLNDKKSFNQIYQSMLESLFDKGILIPGEKTNRFINEAQNQFFTFAPNKIEQDKELPHLCLKK